MPALNVPDTNQAPVEDAALTVFLSQAGANTADEAMT
jgi:hypothetical protein